MPRWSLDDPRLICLLNRFVHKIDAHSCQNKVHDPWSVVLGICRYVSLYAAICRYMPLSVAMCRYMSLYNVICRCMPMHRNWLKILFRCEHEKNSWLVARIGSTKTHKTPNPQNCSIILWGFGGFGADQFWGFWCGSILVPLPEKCFEKKLGRGGRGTKTSKTKIPQTDFTVLN